MPAITWGLRCWPPTATSLDMSPARDLASLSLVSVISFLHPVMMPNIMEALLYALCTTQIWHHDAVLKVKIFSMREAWTCNLVTRSFLLSLNSVKYTTFRSISSLLQWVKKPFTYVLFVSFTQVLHVCSLHLWVVISSMKEIIHTILGVQLKIVPPWVNLASRLQQEELVFTFLLRLGFSAEN